MAELREFPTYSFGPLERRGVMLGLGWTQMLLLGSAVVGVLIMLQLRLDSRLSTGVSLSVLLTAGLTVFVRVGGQPLTDWIPLLLRFGNRRALHRHELYATDHLQGFEVAARGGVVRPYHDGEVLVPQRRPPRSVRDLLIIGAALEGGPQIGVLNDRSRNTYVGVLAVGGPGFVLRDRDEQAQLVEAWSSVLGGYGRHTTPIKRIQWIERAAPAASDGIAQYVRERAAIRPGDLRLLDGDDPLARATRSYLGLLASVGAATQQHECYVALQVDARKAWRHIRQLGGGNVDRGACDVLLAEMAMLSRRLQNAEVSVIGWPSPAQLAGLIRDGYDPDGRAERRALENGRGGRGIHPEHAWPSGSQEAWGYFRSDGCCHTTYHVAEWPRTDVGPTFLAPLLLHTRCSRTVSMTMEPLPARAAIREAEHARVADESDRRIREPRGYLASYRQDAESENAQRVAQELAAGYVGVRFSAYVTVSAPDPNELISACSEVELEAASSGLELERLVGQQELAFTYTLPLGRGL